MRYLALAVPALLCASIAHAVPYTLPTSGERPHTKLTDGGVLLCATWRDAGACDVPAGTYTLHRFTRSWQDRTSTVEIGDAPPANDDPAPVRQVTRVELACEFDSFEASTYDPGFVSSLEALEYTLPCSVACPSGVAVAGEAYGELYNINGIDVDRGFDHGGLYTATLTVTATTPPSVSRIERAESDGYTRPYTIYATAFCQD